MLTLKLKDGKKSFCLNNMHVEIVEKHSFPSSRSDLKPHQSPLKTHYQGIRRCSGAASCLQAPLCKWQSTDTASAISSPIGCQLPRDSHCSKPYSRKWSAWLQSLTQPLYKQTLLQKGFTMTQHLTPRLTQNRPPRRSMLAVLLCAPLVEAHEGLGQRQ